MELPFLSMWAGGGDRGGGNIPFSCPHVTKKGVEKKKEEKRRKEKKEREEIFHHFVS
jgi:hypothetical protein